MREAIKDFGNINWYNFNFNTFAKRFSPFLIIGREAFVTP